MDGTRRALLIGAGTVVACSVVSMPPAGGRRSFVMSFAHGADGRSMLLVNGEPLLIGGDPLRVSIHGH